MLDRGVDSAGFVKTNYSVNNVSKAFKPVLDEALLALEHELGSNLHSIYLYGSVGRGSAVPGKSDLDLSVIVSSALSEEKCLRLHEIEERICLKHKVITKLEFDLGTIDEAMVLNEFAWQFWLKHLCCCIWGEDLSLEIPFYKPSLKVGLEMNKDLEKRLIKADSDMTNQNYLAEGKSISKKLLRTHYSLYAEQDNSFYDSLDDIVRVIKRYEVSQTENIDLALRIAQGHATSIWEIKKLMSDYGTHVLKAFRNRGGTTI